MAALAVIVGLVGPASAHAQLIRTTPTAGQELAVAPTEVTLRFSEGVRPVDGGVRVLAADGTRVDVDRARTRGGVVALPLPELADGAYVVSWRVVSEDGHPVRGAFTFRVGDGGDQATAAKLARQLLGSDTSSTDVSAVAALLRALAFATMAILIGTSINCFWVDHRPGGAGLGVGRLVRWSTVVAALAGIGSFLLYGPLVTGRSLGAITDGPLLRDSFGDHVGRALGARTVAVVLLGLLLRRVIGRRRRVTVTSDPAAFFGAGALIGATAISQAFSGHGATGRHVAIALPATVVHVVAMGMWSGGLVCLLLALRRPDTPQLMGMTRRFSRLAGISVGALALSGSFALWRQAGSITAMRETPSGKLVLVKLGLVSVLILAGAKNRRSLAPNVGAPGALGALRAIRRTIGIEAMLFAGVLGITALIVNLAPARDVVSRPVSLTVATQNGLVDITIDPAKRGPNELHIYALTKDGASRSIEGIEATLSNPAVGVERVKSRVVRAGPNHFQALAFDLPLPGTWIIELRVSIDTFTEETGSASFTLR